MSGEGGINPVAEDRSVAEPVIVETAAPQPEAVVEAPASDPSPVESAEQLVVENATPLPADMAAEAANPASEATPQSDAEVGATASEPEEVPPVEAGIDSLAGIAIVPSGEILNEDGEPLTSAEALLFLEAAAGGVGADVSKSMIMHYENQAASGRMQPEAAKIEIQKWQQFGESSQKTADAFNGRILELQNSSDFGEALFGCDIQINFQESKIRVLSEVKKTLEALPNDSTTTGVQLREARDQLKQIQSELKMREKSLLDAKNKRASIESKMPVDQDKTDKVKLKAANLAEVITSAIGQPLTDTERSQIASDPFKHMEQQLGSIMQSNQSIEQFTAILISKNIIDSDQSKKLQEILSMIHEKSPLTKVVENGSIIMMVIMYAMYKIAQKEMAADSK